MAEVFFFIAAIGAIGGAYGVIRDWNPFYNVLALVVHLISLAAFPEDVAVAARPRADRRESHAGGSPARPDG